MWMDVDNLDVHNSAPLLWWRRAGEQLLPRARHRDRLRIGLIAAITRATRIDRYHITDHSTFVTAPVSVIGLAGSNSAAKEWSSRCILAQPLDRRPTPTDGRRILDKGPDRKCRILSFGHSRN
jgi:hypothetical protein